MEFSDTWDAAAARAGEPLTAEQAQQRDGGEEPYVVLVPSAAAPRTVIAYANGTISLAFLDAHRRASRTYRFTGHDGQLGP